MPRTAGRSAAHPSCTLPLSLPLTWHPRPRNETLALLERIQGAPGVSAPVSVNCHPHEAPHERIVTPGRWLLNSACSVQIERASPAQLHMRARIRVGSHVQGQSAHHNNCPAPYRVRLAADKIGLCCCRRRAHQPSLWRRSSCCCNTRSALFHWRWSSRSLTSLQARCANACRHCLSALSLYFVLYSSECAT